MAEYKDITELKKQIADFKKAIHSPNGDYLTGYMCALSVTEGIIASLPTADAVEVETIKAWLYEMAINNVGCVLDGDFSNACEEIISRLDGLRSFARDRTPKEGEGNDA